MAVRTLHCGCTRGINFAIRLPREREWFRGQELREQAWALEGGCAARPGGWELIRIK